VEALQRCVTGAGLGGTGFDLLALALTGLAGAIAAAGMFRWDRAFRPNKAWVAVALGMWIIVGALAEMRGQITFGAPHQKQEAGKALDYIALPNPAVAPAKGHPASWHDVTDADIDQIAFDRLPPDDGIVAPLSRSDEAPDPAIVPALDRIRDTLPTWAPGKAADPVQRARNLLAIAAVPDILRMEQVERFVPRLVFARLQAVIPPRDLPKILYWIALHPDEGDDSAIHQLDALGLPDVRGPDKPVRGRIMLYAFKLLGRLTGHVPPV
jgi:hypothetical protein